MMGMPDSTRRALQIDVAVRLTAACCVVFHVHQGIGTGMPCLRMSGIQDAADFGERPFHALG